jgi:hypothetical protein
LNALINIGITTFNNSTNPDEILIDKNDPPPPGYEQLPRCHPQDQVEEYRHEMQMKLQGSSQVSSKFGVYKFLVFSEILVHSFKPSMLNYTNRECQPC